MERYLPNALLLSVCLIVITCTSVEAWLSASDFSDPAKRAAYFTPLRTNITSPVKFFYYNTPIPKDRCAYPDHLDWTKVDYNNYKPEYFITEETEDFIGIWADPKYDPSSPANFQFNALDNGLERRSYEGVYTVHPIHGPCNISGPTGLNGPGSLGRLAVNHAGDVLVTRYSGKRCGPRTRITGRNPHCYDILLITRRDGGDYAIIGGLVNINENARFAAEREFHEEGLDSKGRKRIPKDSKIFDEAVKLISIDVTFDQALNNLLQSALLGVKMMDGLKEDPNMKFIVGEHKQDIMNAICEAHNKKGQDTDSVVKVQLEANVKGILSKSSAGAVDENQESVKRKLLKSALRVYDAIVKKKAVIQGLPNVILDLYISESKKLSEEIQTIKRYQQTMNDSAHQALRIWLLKQNDLTDSNEDELQAIIDGFPGESKVAKTATARINSDRFQDIKMMVWADYFEEHAKLCVADSNGKVTVPDFSNEIKNGHLVGDPDFTKLLGVRLKKVDTFNRNVHNIEILQNTIATNQIPQGKLADMTTGYRFEAEIIKGQLAKVLELHEQQMVLINEGIANDYRQTDRSWIESACYHVDSAGILYAFIENMRKPGDDAFTIDWHPLQSLKTDLEAKNKKLFASHMAYAKLAEERIQNRSAFASEHADLYVTNDYTRPFRNPPVATV